MCYVWLMAVRVLFVCLLVLSTGALPGGARGEEGSATIRVTEESGAVGYATPIVVIEVGDEVTFENDDFVSHDVTAWTSGSDDGWWCDNDSRRALDGGCPIFASATIGPKTETPVHGTESLDPGEAYPFYCSIHEWMNGVLVTEPEGAS